MSSDPKLLITPKTRVGELFETYPDLESVLMELAPAFRKLKNPVLRKTIGKVATLQQAAALGNIPVTEIINTLKNSNILPFKTKLILIISLHSIFPILWKNCTLSHLIS